MSSDDPIQAAISQDRKTSGHWRPLPLFIECPAGKTRYVDRVIPGYTRGVDWIRAIFAGGDQVETGDFIVAGKVLFGQIGQVAETAAVGSLKVKIAGPEAYLKTSELEGALDEGFSVSFGTENTTAEAINAAEPTATGARTFANPDQELREYEIRRVGEQTPVGGDTVVVELDLFSALEAEVAAGTPVNLVSAAILEPLFLAKGQTVDVGGSILSSGNIPAGARIRAGFQNNGSATKRVCGHLEILFGGS